MSPFRYAPFRPLATLLYVFVLLFCCACFVARDICFSRAMGFVAFDLLFFICGFRTILRPQRPYMFYHSASPLLGGVLQFRQLVKVGLLGCRSYLALPSATDARSGDTRRKSPPPLAPLATLVSLRVAVSTRSATLRPPNGGCGSLVPRSRSLRSLALGERYFCLCGMPLARLRFFCSFRITSQITPLKNKSFSGAAPDCCCLAPCGGLS